MRLELVSQKKLIGTHLLPCPVDDPVVPGNDWLDSNSVQTLAKFFIWKNLVFLKGYYKVFHMGEQSFSCGKMSPVEGHLVSQPTPEVSSWREILSLQKLDIKLCAIYNACLLLNKIFRYPTT